MQSERRSIGLQLRDRQLVSVEFGELVAALIELNRVTNWSIMPSLVGMIVAFFGTSLSLAWPLAAMFVVLGVVPVVMTRFGRCRLDRVEAPIRAF